MFRRLELAAPDSFDGAFQFCRVVYRGAANGDGADWAVDFPRADSNLMTRMSELTKMPISRLPDGEPNHLLIRLTQPELFKCPFIMMTEVGNIYLDNQEAKALHDYLLKGGFLWADDFWGTAQWEQWEYELRKVLPAAEHPIVDVPMDHPLLRAQFVVTEIPQIPNIGFFRRSGGGTSEQGADSVTPTARIISDSRGRVMVLMTHNTDISDSWEREGEDASYFYAFSPKGYALGINVLLYAMTH